MSKDEEVILAVEREKLFDSEKLVFQGGITGSQSDDIFENISNYYIAKERGALEKDPQFKQPIPYVLIKRTNQFFVYERLVGGGEERLHGKLSLGAGGHMNEIETNSFLELFEENMNRELEEELHITDKNYSIEPIGLINDDSDILGKVHIGIMGVMEVREGTQVSVLETDKLRGLWMTKEELEREENWERLEKWSQIALGMLD